MSETKKAVCDRPGVVSLRIMFNPISMNTSEAEKLMADLAEAIDEAKHDPFEEWWRDMEKKREVKNGEVELFHEDDSSFYISKRRLKCVVRAWEYWKKNVKST